MNVAQSSQGKETQSTQGERPSTQPTKSSQGKVTQSTQGKMPASQGSATQVTEGNGKTHKQGVRRPFVPPWPITRLTAYKNVVGPTTTRSTPTKRIIPRRTSSVI